MMIPCSDASTAFTGTDCHTRAQTMAGGRKIMQAITFPKKCGSSGWVLEKALLREVCLLTDRGCWTFAVYMWALLRKVDPLWRVKPFHRLYFLFLPTSRILFLIASLAPFFWYSSYSSQHSNCRGQTHIWAEIHGNRVACTTY